MERRIGFFYHIGKTFEVNVSKAQQRVGCQGEGKSETRTESTGACAILYRVKHRPMKS